MTGKLLQAIGVLAVLGLAGFGAMGLFVFKDRVRVIVQDDTVQADDPTAVLRDDVATLRTDMQALTQALSDNLGQMMQVLEDAALLRQRELLSAVQGLDTIQQETAAIRGRMTGLEREVAKIVDLGSLRADQATALVGEPSSVVEPAAAETAAGERTADELIAPEPIAPEPIAAEPIAPPDRAADVAEPAADVVASKPKGFLSFSLPSRSFHFDREQRFEVLANLSRVGFDAKSTLHDFSGVTSDIQGELVANLADAAGAWQGVVDCRADKLITGVEGRDTAMYEHLDTEEHPSIKFELTGFEPAPDGIDAQRLTVKGNAKGRMTIRGVTKDMSMPVELQVDSSKRLVVEGQVMLHLPDYEVPVPSKLGMINMDPDVKVWIALRMRVKTGADR